MVGYTIAFMIMTLCAFWLIRVAVELGVAEALRKERAFIEARRSAPWEREAHRPAPWERK